MHHVVILPIILECKHDDRRIEYVRSLGHGDFISNRESKWHGNSWVKFLRAG